MFISYLTDTAVGSERPGVARLAERRLNHLAASGHRVEWLDRPMSVTRLRQRWRGADRPDIVHVGSAGPLAWAALQAARAEGIATSADLRRGATWREMRPGMGWLRRLAPATAANLTHTRRRGLHALADCNFITTPEQAAQSAAEGFERLHVLGWGVDADAFSPVWRDSWLRREWRAADDQPVMLLVGALVPGRHIEMALQVFEQLQGRDKPPRMVVVGDGELRGDFERLHPRVRFVGVQHGSELARHYASADVLMCPAPDPSAGAVVLEGMASGLAVAAFNTATASVCVANDSNGCLARLAPGLEGQHAFRAACLRALGAAQPGSPLRRQAREAALQAGWAPVLCEFERQLRRLVTVAPEAAMRQPRTVAA